MSSVFEPESSVSEVQDRPDLVEIHNCVRDTLANLEIAGIEFSLELEAGHLKITIQTSKFLEAQELAVELGNKIESIAPAEITDVAVYKRKSATANVFLIKEMTLKKAGAPEIEEVFVAQVVANSTRSSTQQSSQLAREYRPKFRMYGLLNSYLIRIISAITALGLGILGVQMISRIFDGMEQKPLTYIDVNQLPGLGAASQSDTMNAYQVAFPRGNDRASRFLVYLPNNPNGAKLPCVFIAPSGTTPLYGRNLEQFQQWDYTPFISAGYAVVLYDVDGDIEHMSEVNEATLLNQPSKIVTARLKAYKASDAGVLNAKLAIDYAIARIPQIDPNLIYTAGYGAGGTLSLMVAATDSRVKGAISFTPVTDLPKNFSTYIDNISTAVPGYKEFIQRSSPYDNASKMTKPLFIFHNEASTVNSLEDTNKFVELASKTNSAVTYVHAQEAPQTRYDVPLTSVKQSIEWLNNQNNRK
jgi:dienelactone hydrolase